MRDVVAVTLSQRLMVRGGGLLLPGEVARFPLDVAADLVERGVAAYAEAEGKSMEAPPADKMVGGRRSGEAPRVRKKG